MIVPMKKVSIIVLDAERRKALNVLKRLGVVHIENMEAANEDITRLEARRADCDRALLLLPAVKKPEPAKEGLPDDADAVIAKILGLQERKRTLQEEMERLTREAERISPWGDFEPGMMRELAEKGVRISLHEGLPAEFTSVSNALPCAVISRSKSLVRFAALSIGRTAAPAEVLDQVKEFIPQEKGLSALSREKEKKQEELDSIEKEFAGFVPYRGGLENALQRVEKIIEFERVHEGMGMEGSLSYLSGFAPFSDVPQLKEAAAEQGWGLMMEDPAETDAVPSLVRNPKWIKIIDPVFGMLGTVPGYREFDISFFFLLFFSFFVSMIIGDAGYGCILFIITAFLMIKSAAGKKPVSPGMVLFLVLSISTIIWGSLTGTWFSNKQISEIPFLARFRVEALYAFNPRSSELIKYICFIVGTIHISIAHIWNFISQLKKKPLIKSFAQLGWLSMGLGLFYLVLNMVLDAAKFPLPKFALFLIIGGVGFIIIFGKQEGKFFKGLLQGVGGLLTTFLSSIGFFSDIISYIRLFAVGLATVAIAQSFNAMASGGKGIAGIIGSVLILVFGHTLNLAMGALSVIVHGVRLNMLEFSGHLGMEWTGFQYKPFGSGEIKE
ncbi:MAG: V-type ATP synthase subunit I [Spirochaetales bacterium]|nr:MAG: V-type ATP synthase subunit I [Spirochaetales bacterium]